MDSPHQSRRLQGAPAIVSITLILLTIGYFQNSRPGWNANSQFGLTFCLAEKGTFHIDAVHNSPILGTGDKAVFEDHYYCDKSPLTPMLGVPACWLFGKIARPMGRYTLERARYWTIWWTLGTAAAVFTVLLARLLMRRGAGEANAWRAALLWIAATPLLGYSIVFYQYGPACALALGGYACLFPGGAAWPVSGRRLFWGGVLTGLAVWALATFGLLAMILTSALLALAPARQWPRLWPWALGGLTGAAGNFIYNHAIFGSFGFPYAHEADAFFREQMSRGLMGATRPRAIVAWLITFHPFQGLFLWFPLTASAMAGLLKALGRDRATGRSEAAIGAAFFALLLLYVSAYFMWWGGWAYAPRHLIPALAVMGLGMAPWLASPNPWARRALFTTGLIGAAINLSAVALDPQPPPVIGQTLLLNPVHINEWPSPMMTLLRYVWQGWQTDANWGTALGLKGPPSLAPLVAVWALGFWGLGRFQSAPVKCEVERSGTTC